MARSSLANSSSNLNLSRRLTELFQQMIMVGNEMYMALNPKHPLPSPEESTKLKQKWSDLLIALVEMLL